MQDMINRMKGEAERVVGRVAQPRMATVSSYDPDRYMAKVKLQPEGFETGWAPIASQQVGNGWGVFSPPSIGDQVMVLFQEGNGGSPVIVGSFYSDQDRPVLDDIKGTPVGETRIVGKAGGRIRLLEDGTIEIRRNGNVQVVMRPDDSVEINAPVLRIGAIGSAFKKLVMDTFMAVYNSHTHQGTGPVQSGQMTPQHLTSNLTGA